jgi:hypothetical protein
MKIKETKDGRYKIVKKWPIIGAENTIIVTKQELKDLYNILLNIHQKSKQTIKSGPIAFGLGDHPDFKYED